MKDFIIIGAGLCGLHMAKKISELGLGTSIVLEKSRGVGGRMATRRTLETRFDHGAQFYRVKSDIAKIHNIWKDEKISHQWFFSSKGDHWCANNGMTALAKQLSATLDIQLEKQVQSIHYEAGIWKLTSDKNETWQCRHLILTAPLPQALILLEKSKLDNLIDLSEVKNIHYSKALIALISLESDFEINEFGYEEFLSGDFFSIANQKQKGLSAIPAYTFTMSPNFSENEFDNPEEIVLAKILKIIQARYPNIKISGSELKKWRYCQAQSTYKNLFCEVAPKLFLTGDAFGGSSLLGAIRSSEGLISHLLED